MTSWSSRLNFPSVVTKNPEIVLWRKLSAGCWILKLWMLDQYRALWIQSSKTRDLRNGPFIKRIEFSALSYCSSVGFQNRKKQNVF